MSLRRPWMTLVPPRADEVDWLLDYARRLSGLTPSRWSDRPDADRARGLEWLETGRWFSSSSCFEGGGCGPGEPWHQHDRKRIAVWRDSADKSDPEQRAFAQWARRAERAERSKSPADEPEIPPQTWATLTWAEARALLRERDLAAQLSIFDLLGAAAGARL